MTSSTLRISCLISPVLFVLIGWFVFWPIYDGRVIVDPIAIQLGPISIHWYGIILATAIGGAYEWTRRRLIVRGINPALAESIVWWGSICGIIGARLGFVLQNVSFYVAHPAQILAITQGGLSIHGAVLAGVLGVWWASRHSGKPLLFFLDTAVVPVLAGAIVGRIGNFVNYELYGYPTSVVWKMFVPLGFRLPGYEEFSFFHPTFLYEGLLNLLMLGIVLWYERTANREPRTANTLRDCRRIGFWIRNWSSFERKRLATTRPIRFDKPRRRRTFAAERGNFWPECYLATAPLSNSRLPFAVRGSPGTIFFLTLTLYSVSRFIVEFFRIGRPLGWHLTLAQWVSLAIIMASFVVLTRPIGPRYNLIKN